MSEINNNTQAVNSIKELVQSLVQAKNYLDFVWSYATKIVDLENKKNQLQREIDEKIPDHIKIGTFSLLVGILALVFALSWSGVFILGFFSPIFFIVMGIAIVISLIAFLTIPKAISKIKKLKIEIEKIDKEITQLDDERLYFECEEPIKTYKSIYDNFFPLGNMSPQDVTYIINLISTSRANTFQEALNLFDEHMHRENLEKATYSQLKYLRQISVSSTSAAASAAEAVAAANTSANANTYNAYYK